MGGRDAGAAMCPGYGGRQQRIGTGLDMYFIMTRLLAEENTCLDCEHLEDLVAGSRFFVDPEATLSNLEGTEVMVASSSRTP